MAESPDISALIQQSLVENRQVYLAVSSNSMAPIFCEGDEIKIVGIEAAELSPGKILALNKNNTYLAHRLICTVDQAGQLQLITKGDRLLVADRPHPVSDLLGLVVARRRKGHVLEFDRGKGLWLASAVAKLYMLEARLTIRTGSERSFKIAGQSTNPARFRLVHRIVHWLVYRLTLILLRITKHLP